MIQGWFNALMASGGEIVLRDTFRSGSTIDTSKWTITTNGLVTFTQTDGVGLNLAISDTIATFFQNNIASIATVANSSSGATVEFYMDWDDPQALNKVCGALLYFDSQNYVSLRNDDTVTGRTIRINIVKGNNQVIDFLETEQLKASYFRITYDFTTFNIKVFYKKGLVWYQFFETVSFNLGTSARVMFAGAKDSAPKVGSDNLSIKDVVLYNTALVGEQSLGAVITQNFASLANLSNYTDVSPTAVFALSGGFLNVQYNPGAGGTGDYLQYDPYGSTQLNNFKMTLRFIPRNKTATSFGIGVGIRSTNTTNTQTYTCFFDCDTSANSGKVRIDRNGASLSGFSATAVAFSIGDTIRLELIRVNNHYLCSAYNETTGIGQFVRYFASLASTAVTPNTCGKPVINSYGGTQDIISLTVESSHIYNPNVLCIGDSITQGYTAGNELSRFVSLIRDNTTRTVQESSHSGAKTNDILLCMPEILSFDSTYVILMIGGNDVSNSIAQATYEANYTSIVTQLKNAGVTVVHCRPTPRDAFNMTTLYTFIDTFASAGDLVIDTFTPLKGAGTDLGATWDSGDGTHENSAGHTVIKNTVVSVFTYLTP